MIKTKCFYCETYEELEIYVNNFLAQNHVTASHLVDIKYAIKSDRYTYFSAMIIYEVY